MIGDSPGRKAAGPLWFSCGESSLFHAVTEVAIDGPFQRAAFAWNEMPDACVRNIDAMQTSVQKAVLHIAFLPGAS
jgi:hypothetical protein